MAVRKHVSRTDDNLHIGDICYPLNDFDNIFLIGAGKAAAPMAKAIEDLLGSFLTSGCIIVKYHHTIPQQKTQVIEAGHPIPDEAGVQGTEEILKLLQQCSERDLVICVFSGGGSALLTAPVSSISHAEKQLTTRLLLECGATITEINSIRKKMSRVKGGRLAKAAYPAKVAALFLSDVVDDRLDVISSGPTVADQTTYSDCLRIFSNYGLADRLPPKVIEIFKKGVFSQVPKMAEDVNHTLSGVQNLIVGNNKAALMAAREAAAAHGYPGLVLSSRIQGEAKEVAQVLVAVAKEIRHSSIPLSPPACILAGGETTVTIKGDGRGGRNQEFALSAAIALDDWKGIHLLSAGTDGTDGPTDAAGAFASGHTCQNARRIGMDPLDYLTRNDSHSFFRNLDDLLKTGPTRTNVMDLICILID